MKLLLKNIDELRAHVTVTADFKFVYIEPYLRKVQVEILHKFFGRNFINALAELHDTNNTSDTQKELVDYLGSALANLAFVKALPSMLISMGASGIYQTEKNNEKPVYQWQKLEYENNHLESGWNALGNGIEFCIEKRLVDGFELWMGSDAEKNAREFFAFNPEMFNQSYPIASSFRTFEALKPFMREVQKFNIKGLIGVSLYNEVTTQLMNLNLSLANQALLPYLRDALCNAAIIKSIGRLNVKLDAEGMRVISIAGSGTDNFKNQQAAGVDALSDLRNSAQEAANLYEQQLVQFLYTNANDYPLFKLSETYSEIANESSSINSADSKTTFL